MFWPPVRTEQKLADDELPVISLLCPLYREQESVNNLIRSLMAIDYPTNKLDVIILTEPDDPSTARAIDQHWPQLRVLINQRPGPKTKPHALNFGLSEAKGDIIGVYDAEDRPEAQQLRKVAQAFAERSNLGCVQARLNYYNADETILSQMFCLEYSLHFDYMLPGMAAMGLPLPLGGTSNFVRKDALLSVGGWDAHNVTEDADLGLRLAQRGYALSTIASTTLEEAPERCGPWIKQRSRWLKGYLQTWFVHTRNFSDWRGGLVLHATLGSVVLNALVTPWLLAAFVLSYITAWSWLDQIFAPALETPALALWVVGNFFHAWLLAMAPIRRGWFTPTTAIIILPFYSLLLSCAAYRAVYSFLFAPHYWAKTEHSPGEDITRGTARA
ncbi:MAG: glycosyltransferase [Parvularculaceae bacterium]|nr:glycosyltransferase [Parvularculaceae bacterium]